MTAYDECLRIKREEVGYPDESRDGFSDAFILASAVLISSTDSQEPL